MKENKRLSILVIILLVEIILTAISYIDFKGIDRYFNNIKSQKLSKSKDLEIEMVNNSVFRNLTSSINDKRKKMIIDDENNKQKPQGRYSNITADKKIDWRTFEGNVEHSAITYEMFKKITLDGKKISVPISLKDLGEEYSELENVDYHEIRKTMLPLSIKDTKRNVTFIPFLINNTYSVKKISDFFTIHVETLKGKPSEIAYEVKDIYPLRMTILKDGKYLMEGEIDPKDKKIISLSSDYSHYIIGPPDIRIDGIGIGSTFNEMYEKFGKPSFANQAEDIIIYYTFIDNLGNSYYIAFAHSNEILVGSKYKKTRPNVITDINFYFKDAL